MHAAQVPSAETLRIERKFQASPERVFQAWTSPEELNRWSDPDPRNAEAEVDLRVGGRYRIAMSRPDGTVHRVTGVYREILPPSRLVYTWAWESMPGFPETIVTVEFRACNDGGTDVLLVHEGLPNEEARAKHEHGWAESMRKLASAVE
ncbi:MAG: SRPBCC domain-containing protein [Gemmatimonadota bacterium]|nr:SRPBCC domain-containing protein [Gemmatimonadota bacterium]